MKLVQQLLLAPAALGLLAPVASQAAELNINGVSDYASVEELEQVTSITQFSDVVPTDYRLGLPGPGQPDRALRLCRRLSQRHLPRQPGDDPL